jgi:protein PhnA
MSRGRQQHDARQAAIAGLGRQLSRRAKNRCELCDDHTSLKVVEIAPVLEDPDPDRAIMVCERCITVIQDGKRGRPDPSTLRFLEGTVWAEVLPAQLAAVRATRNLAGSGVQWATDLLDGLYLDEETEALLGE